MDDGVRRACLALVKSRTNGSTMGWGPRPIALGWKLQIDTLPAAEIDDLCAAVHAALDGAAAPRRWMAPAVLRDLLAEYRQVRRETRPAPGGRHAGRGRSAARPGRLRLTGL
jgi:hypothetical protein